MAVEQLSLFPAFVEEPPAFVELSAPEPQPAEGQLGLFDGAGAHVASIGAAVAEGRLSDALRIATNVAGWLAEANAWRLLLQELHEAVEGTRSRPEELAKLARRWSEDSRRANLPHAMAVGLVRGLFRLCAQAAEVKELGSIVSGRPAGWYWLQAGCREEAQRSLDATVDRGELVGLSLVLLGNLAFEAGEAQAGGLYRRAFIRDPLGVPLEEIANVAVRELVEDARDLELEPPEAWVPVVGEVRGVLPMIAELSRDERVAKFQAVWARSREATARNTPDVSARRELKALAPALFDLLREEGRF